MNKLFTKIASAFVGIAMAVGVGVSISANHSSSFVRAAEGDTHSITGFTGEGVGTVVNNGVTPSAIEVADPGYTIKQVIIGWKHNKSNNGVTATITVGGDSLGSGKVGGQNTTTTTTIGDGNTSLSGAVSITWANGMTGTGKGTLYINTLTFVEGSGGGVVTTYTISYNSNGGSGTMEDSTGSNPAVAACTFTAPTGKTFDKWNTAANGSGTDYAVGAKPGADLDLFAIWKNKPLAVTLDKIGTSLSTTANTEMETVDILDDEDNTYTLNYYQCKKQGDSMFMTKSVNAFVSNHTAIPGTITSVELFINSGASGSATYDVAFGTSEFTTATAGIGAENITGGNSHSFDCDVADATYFCVTLGAAYNGQVLKIVVNYETPAIETVITDGVKDVHSSYEINVGDTLELFFRLADDKTIILDDVTWTSSNTAIFDHSGSYSGHDYMHGRGKAAGTVTVTASKSGYKSQSVTVVVSEDPTLPEMEIWDNTWKLTDASGFWWTDQADYYWVYAHPAGDTEKEAGERTILGGVTWTSSDTTVATITNQPGGQGSLTALKPGETTLTAIKDGYKSCSVTISFNAGAVTELKIYGSMTKTSYTTNDNWDPAGFTVKAYHGNTGWEDDVTAQASWTYNPAAPAKDVTSVVATASWNDGEDDYSVSSSAQVVTVTVQHAGTADDPFTVAEALAKANEIGAVGNTGQGPWVTRGIISRVTSAPVASYWNATYYISDDGSTNNELQVYRGFYIDNVKFDATTAALLTVGKIVVVTGNLTGSYGCEYCQGNYLLSLETPSTGDVNVTFEPETSFEIGTNGTFSATCDGTNPEYTFSVEDSSIMSVDSDGYFVALALGTTKVTVSVTATEGTGEAHAFVTVNANSTYTVTQAKAIAAALPSGDTTPYYIYVEGYISQFDSDGQARTLKINTYDEADEIIVFTGKSGYSTFIEGMKLGDYLKVKANVQNYSGTYELQNPEKVTSSYTEISLAIEFLSETDAQCSTYVDGSSDYDEFKTALQSIFNGFTDRYASLDGNAQQNLIDEGADESGTQLQKALARYDYLSVKYNLTGFITGREVDGRIAPVVSSNVDSNNSMMLVAIIAVTSITSIAVLLVLKRRKSY